MKLGPRVPLVLLIVAALMPAGRAAAAEFTPATRVSEVTVYRQAALVTREARLTLPPGSHRVLLGVLPALADPDSVRVSGSGPAGMEIGGVEVLREFRPPAPPPDHSAIDREIDDLNRQMSLVNDRRQSIATLREFLTALKTSGGQASARDALTKGFAVESWRSAFEFFSTRLNGLSEEERVLDLKQRDLGRRLEVARGRLSQMPPQNGVQSWTAAVLVAAPKGGDLTLRASYLATGATWQPSYDARLDPATGRVSLSWQAQVLQATGEDWKDVAVALSTTRPSAGIDLPVLASLNLTPLQRLVDGMATFNSEFVNALPILGRNYQDILALKAGVAEVGAEGDGPARGGVAGGVVAQAPPVQPLTTAVASAALSEVAVTFTLPGRMDVPGDGQPHKRLIATRDMGARVEHRAVPLAVPAVFMVATVTLPGEVPMLAGRIQHFVGTDLVGVSTTPDRAAGEEFSLSFGPDDRLKVARRRVEKSTERRGKDDEIRYRFVTTLENHVGRDDVVEVKDRIPVSGDERIEVTLDDDETTAGAAKDPDEPGILTWKVPVPKDGKKEVALVYRVRSPRSVAVAGLD